MKPRVLPVPADTDEQIKEAVRREESRLRSFIRKRVPDPRDVEDILQDVFFKLVEANRLLMPIDHVTGWLFRVAQNRIVDLFRARRHEWSGTEDGDRDFLDLEDLLPSSDESPEALYARRALSTELRNALDELPGEQRAVFVAHEIEGKSFNDIARETGVNVNTLLSRKRYAVLHLRTRLQQAFEEFTQKRPRPCRAEDEQIRGEASAKKRARGARRN